MGIYRIAWLAALGVLAFTGVWVAVGSVPPATLVSLGLCAVIVGPLLGAGIRAQTRRPGAAASFPYLLAAAAGAVISVIAVSGLTELSGAIALPGIALLVVLSPAVLRRLVHRSPQPAPVEPPPGEPPIRALPSFTAISDAELCWRWRTSYSALHRAASLAEQLDLIATRSALLDELAARDPAGFTRWMHSGARAASDPARFLTAHRGDE